MGKVSWIKDKQNMKLKINKTWNVSCCFHDSFSDRSPRQNEMDSPYHSEFAHIHKHLIYRRHRHNYHQVLQVQHVFRAPTHSTQSAANDIPLLTLGVFCLCRSFSFHEQFHFTFFFLIGRLLLRLPVLMFFWTSLACSFSSSFLRGLEASISLLTLPLFLAVRSSYLPPGSGDFFSKLLSCDIHCFLKACECQSLRLLQYYPCKLGTVREFSRRLFS